MTYEVKEQFFRVEMWDAEVTITELIQSLDDAIKYARMIEDLADHVEISGPYNKWELNNV